MTYFPARDKFAARARYEAALAAVTDSAPRVPVPVWDELGAAAADYATTTEGSERVTTDYGHAVRALEFEKAAVLRAALRAASTGTKARADVSALTSQPKTGPASAVRAGQAAARSWSAAEPIWPNSDTVADAIHAARVATGLHDDARRLFRSLYADVWASLFVDASGAPRSPASDKVGWDWRTTAIDAARKTLLGVRTTTTDSVKPGAKIWVNGKLRALHSKEPAGTQRLAGADGTVVDVQMWMLEFPAGLRVGPVRSDQMWLTLPD